MENIIKLVNELQRACTPLGDFGEVSSLRTLIDALPTIAVVGGQSSGKSSVLESLVGKDFLPRGSGIVTRRPLVLQLHRIFEEKEYAEFAHQPRKRFTDFGAVRKEIADDTDRETGRSRHISSVPIYLSIHSPNVVNLTLVDLPGLTKLVGEGQSESIVADIENMVRFYIEKPNCIILAVSPANQDLATSDAIKIAREVDPQGERTFGVLTKIDLMDKGTDAVDILEGRSNKLKYPWIGVLNRSQADINKSVDTIAARKREHEYFSTTPEYKHLASKMGSEHLGKVLSKHVETVIKSRIPGLQSLINKAMIELESELGKPIATDAGGKLSMIMEICRAFDQTSKEQLDDTASVHSAMAGIGSLKFANEGVISSSSSVSTLQVEILTTTEAVRLYWSISAKLEYLIESEATEAEIQKSCINEVLRLICTCINRDEAALDIAQKVFNGMYENASNTTHVGAHLDLLAAIREVSELVFEELTSWVIYSDRDRKYNKDITIGLIRRDLLNLAEYNAYMSRLLDAGRNYMAREFGISLIQTLVASDSRVISELHDHVDAFVVSDSRVISELHHLVDALAKPLKRVVVEADRLSNLPDDIIHKILSRLDVVYAVRSSVLSSRWRDIWTRMPTLNFTTRLGPKYSSSFYPKFVKNLLSVRNNRVEVYSASLLLRVKETHLPVDTILKYAFSLGLRQLSVDWYRTFQVPPGILVSDLLEHLEMMGTTIACRTNSTNPPWNFPALTTLYLHRVKLIGCSSALAVLLNLKNLTLEQCDASEPRENWCNGIHINFSGLVNLILKKVKWFADFVSVETPELKNLIFVDTRCKEDRSITDLSGGLRISAREITFLRIKASQFFELSLDASVEKIDLCISSPHTTDVEKICHLFLHLQSVKSLSLSLEIVQLLSPFFEGIFHQSSPFDCLESLKVYPRNLEINPTQLDAAMEVASCMISRSPNATMTVVSHEEARAIKVTKETQRLMFELRKQLRKVEADVEYRMDPVLREKAKNDYSKDLTLEYRRNAELLITALLKIGRLFNQGIESKKAEMKEKCLKLKAEVQAVLDKIYDEMKTLIDARFEALNNSSSTSFSP